MSLLHQSAFLKALGWTLIDSLWQMGVLWLIYVIITGNGKRFDSTKRHGLALASLASGCLLFIATLTFRFYLAVSPASAASNDVGSINTLVTGLFPWFDNSLPYLSAAYLAATLVLFVRLIRQYHSTYRIRTSQLKKAGPELRVFVRDTAGFLGIRKEVKLWLSDLVDTPLTLGFWKPMILLPVAAVNHLSTDQAEAILLHELNHIRRNDYLINLLIAIVDAVLFFNPFAAMLTGYIRKERENSCDDTVLQFRYQPASYAKALLLLEKNRTTERLALVAVAATGKGSNLLLNRIRRILNDKPAISPIGHKLFAYLFIFGLLGFIGYYNPGAAIAETIEPIIPQTAVLYTEQPLVFETKEIENEEAEELRTEGSSHVRHALTEEDQADLLADAAASQHEAAMEIQEESNPIAEFVTSLEPLRDFSIIETNTNLAPPTDPGIAHPYVPSMSFDYQIMEDTAMPKKYVMTFSEKEAKEALEKTLKGLEEIDWKKLEKSLEGKDVDIKKLRKELMKLMNEVDWKKINEEMQQAEVEAQNEIRAHEDLRMQLKQYQKQAIVRQEENRKAQEAILLDRINETQKCEQLKSENKAKVVKQKKVVVI